MSRPRLPRSVVLLGLAALLNDTASEMIYPLLPIFLTGTVGATPLIVGLIEGSADALSSVLKLGAGWLSDRLGRRKPLVVAGYALAAISRVGIALAVSWPFVMLARLVDRTGKGIRSAPRDAMISEVTAPGDRGRAFGFHRALDHTGAVIGPLVAAFLLATFHFPLRTIFLLAAIPGAVGVAMLVVALADSSRRPSFPTAPAVVEGVPERKRFWRALIPIMLFALANSSDAFLLLRASATGIAVHWLPLLWAAHHVIRSLFSTHFGALSDRVGRRALLGIGWAVYAFLYLIFPFAETVGTFFLLFVLYAIPFTLTEGAERAWVAEHARTATGGTAFGTYYLVVGILNLGGTALFGWLYQSFAPITAFHTGAGFAIFAVVAIALVPSEKRPESVPA